MKIRKLLLKDTMGILEWMQDSKINCFFRFDPKKQTEETVKGFIKNSYTELNRHYAVTDDNDEYLGTVSLKNIDKENQNAEYAISMRKKAQGTGASAFGTKEVLKVAFCELKLKKVYLNVLSENLRAIGFYKKMGATYEGTFKDHIKIKDSLKSLDWYCWMENVK